MSTRMTPSDAANIIRHLSNVAAMDQSEEGRAVVGRVNAHLLEYIRSEEAGKINDGGPAFPMQEPQAIHAYAAAACQHIPAANADERDRVYMTARAQAIGGMSLRDYFAAKAMQAWLVGVDSPKVERCAEHAFEVADAMLKTREGGAS
jgi:hypothetical protein